MFLRATVALLVLLGAVGTHVHPVVGGCGALRGSLRSFNGRRFFVSDETVCVQCVSAQCRGKSDIIIAIPGSEVIPGQEFYPFERFLINLVSYFQIDPDNVNVGLILYGREPIAMAWLQPFKNSKQINTRISLMSQRQLQNDRLSGGNDVAAALVLMQHMFKNPSGYPLLMPRPGVRRIGVMFTYDGVLAEDQINVADAARNLKTEGVTMYAVGKGQTGPEFGTIGSDYCKSFSMGRFIDGLPSVLAYLGSSICTEMDPSVTVSEENCFPQLYQRKEPEVVQCSPTSVVFEDPDNCAYFYHCLFRRPVQEKCPLDMLFDPIAKSCNTKEFVSCYSAITCPKRDGLFPHPSECSKYVNCFDFRPYIQSCPGGLWFDVNTGSCAKAQTVACALH